MKSKIKAGFTLIELLTVISIIAVLTALSLSGAGFIQKKGARSRAQSEIKALEAACESYKADNGSYPMATGTTDQVAATRNQVAANGDYNPTLPIYKNSSLYLYGQLSGDTAYTGQVATGARVYMEFKPSMLGITTTGSPISATNKVTSINDPFGFSYGYSTASTTTSGVDGYNPTFDLWSTAGTTTPATSGTQLKWITNW